MRNRSILLLLFLQAIGFSVFCQVANFIIPDTVCVNQDVVIKNSSIGGITFYWNFCSGNLATTPIGQNLGNTGALNGPVYSAIAKDGNDYFVFITNVNDGTLTRLSFGNSLTNYPVSTNLGTLGLMIKNIEGIQIKKDSITGNWFGLIAGGENRYLIRLNFGNSLHNVPSAVNLGNIDNLMHYPHTIYTFTENGNWYSLIGNSDLNNLIRLDFGNSLANNPSAISLGNIGGLSEPVGFYPILDNGTWYLFVVNRFNNTLSRLNFGSSLLNFPTGINLGSIGGKINTPRSLTIIKDCGQVFGFVVNEIPDDIVRLTFPNGLSSTPTGVSLGNIADFSFPHHISELFRVGDSLYAFIMNVDNSTISRLCFPGCTNASISSSNIQNPPAYSYNLPGTYNVSLVINEGMPTQSNICREVVAVGIPVAAITGDTTLCAGDTLTLTSTAEAGCIYHWSGPDNFTSSNPIAYIPSVDTANAGIYMLFVSLSGCASEEMRQKTSVNLVPEVDLGNDTTICDGENMILNAGNTATEYQWNTGEKTPTILVKNPGYYTVVVYNGNCSAHDEISITECSYEIWFPNAFTPEKSSPNDRFKPVFQKAPGYYKIHIFNRWGQQLYKSKDAFTGWDGTFEGKQCAGGPYFYIAEYSLGDENSAFKQKVKRGSVTLLR